MGQYTRFLESDFHPEAALAMWRQLITASTHLESPLHIAAPDSLRAEAVAYFGDYVPQTMWEDAIPSAATILVAPSPQTGAEAYWEHILRSEKPWRIFSYAPLVQHNGTPKALLLAEIEAEPSDDDIAYFVGGTPANGATALTNHIWSLPGYHTEMSDARFLGVHARLLTKEKS